MLAKFIRKLKRLYSSQPATRKLVKKISGSAVYFCLTKKRIESKIRKSQPFNLVIETSNFCNARCLMCPHPRMKRLKGIMSDSVFEKIIERVRAEKLPINKVFFSGLGEPLSDPQIIARIKAFKELGVTVKLYTNASLLTEKISRQLVELAVDEVNISFNGANPEQYREIMGLNFSLTKGNIDRLLEIKKEKQSSWPKTQISLILLKENEKDINQHLKNWQEKVDSVTVSLAHEWGGGVKLNEKLKMKNEKLTYPCRSLWHTFNILNNGDFTICCRDFEGKHILGNVLTHSFAEIIQTPILKTFREAHLKFSESVLPAICRQCNFPYQDGIEWYVPRSLD